MNIEDMDFKKGATLWCIEDFEAARALQMVRDKGYEAEIRYVVLILETPKDK